MYAVGRAVFLTSEILHTVSTAPERLVATKRDFSETSPQIYLGIIIAKELHVYYSCKTICFGRG